MRPLDYLWLGAIRQQHPYRNFQPPPSWVDDRHRAVSPLRAADDLKASPMERVEWIDDLDMRIFRAQGIVGVDGLILMSTASFPPVASLPTAPRWIESSHRFFLPVHVLSRVFRGKFCQQLRELFQQNRLQFHNSLQQLASPDAFSHFLWQLGQKDWVVYAKPPFGGAEHVLNYLARYTHRVAISNHRLVAFENDRVSFRWRDYAHGGKKKVMTLSADEFLRRFLLHVLPKGLVRIRHFGLFANRRRETALARCRELLGTAACAERPEATNLLRCPVCSGTMLVIERITSAQLYFRPDLNLATPQRCSVDSS